jgi:hypothetical protein
MLRTTRDTAGKTPMKLNQEIEELDNNKLMNYVEDESKKALQRSSKETTSGYCLQPCTGVSQLCTFRYYQYKILAVIMEVEFSVLENFDLNCCILITCYH